MTGSGKQLPVSCCLVLLLLRPTSDAQGQGITAGLTGLFGDPNRTQYSFAWLFRPLGIVEASVGGTLLDGDDGRRTGVQLELDFFRRSSARLYAAASLSGGWGSDGAENPWGAWSAGLGYRLLRVGGSDLGVEARYLHLGQPDDALSLGARLAIRFGRGEAPRVPEPTAPVAGPPGESNPPPLATAAAAAPALQLVVQTAIDAMGTPYVWGGTGANGFDCSGLIQYAYGRHGITLPRTSAEQARAGILVPRDPHQLLPGDVLAFAATPGGPVSHVGLYLGDRRFIHSASDGVRISLLREDDPAGRHWWQRWLGARRLVDGTR